MRVWTRTATALAATAALVSLTAGCGSDRPSADDISSTLQKGVDNGSGSKVKLTKKQADCAADIFVKSDLSDGALRAIADGDEGYKAVSRDNKALTTIRTQLEKCTTS